MPEKGIGEKQLEKAKIGRVSHEKIGDTHEI